MTTKTPSQAAVNANYVVNPANGQIKVVVTKKAETAVAGSEWLHGTAADPRRNKKQT